MTSPGRVAASRAVVALALLALLSACASIPTSGPVRAGGDPGLDRADVAVPPIGVPPVRGAAPEDVVRGFLRASADFLGDHAVARLYLTGEASSSWRPSTGTSVYDRVNSQLTVVPGEDGTVTVRGAEVATIDAEGGFRRTPEGTEVARTFRMTQVEGQWRIAGLEDGLLLSMVDVQESFRPVSLYFLSPSRNTLVPDTVLLPELPGLSTKLVGRLLRGPTSALRGAVGTAFPQGTSLEVASVPVRDGVATVPLDENALRADDDAREQLSAQIVWTLKQLGPEIQRIRITAGGEDLVISGVSVEQGRNSWQTYDPDGLNASSSVYVVRDGRLGRIIDNEFQPLDGAVGSGAQAVRTPAVSLDETRIAAVSTDGSALLLGRLAADALPLRPALSGGDFSRPSWDPLGNLWVVDRAAGHLLVLPPGADSASLVTLPKLPGGSPTAAAVSRDGARIALVTGTGRDARLGVGALTGVDLLGSEGTEPAVEVVAVREVLPDLRTVRDASWSSADSLTALGRRSDLPLRALDMSIDGFEVRDLEPLSDLVAVAAAPLDQGRPLVVGTADGRLELYTSSRGWTNLGPGSDPAYPG